MSGSGASCWISAIPRPHSDTYAWRDAMRPETSAPPSCWIRRLELAPTTPDTPQSPEGTIPASGPHALRARSGAIGAADATSAALQLERVLAERAGGQRMRCGCLFGGYLARAGSARPPSSSGRFWRKHRDDPETLYLLGRTYEGLAAATAEEMFEAGPGFIPCEAAGEAKRSRRGPSLRLRTGPRGIPRRQGAGLWGPRRSPRDRPACCSR